MQRYSYSASYRAQSESSHMFAQNIRILRLQHHWPGLCTISDFPFHSIFVDSPTLTGFVRSHHGLGLGKYQYSTCVGLVWLGGEHFIGNGCLSRVNAYSSCEAKLFAGQSFEPHVMQILVLYVW